MRERNFQKKCIVYITSHSSFCALSEAQAAERCRDSKVAFRDYFMLSKLHAVRDGQTYAGQRDPPGQSSVYIAPGDTWKENYRLSTFRRFPPDVPVSPANLASSGFYYTGFKDRVKCFSCGLCVENWIVGDNAADKEWHRTDCDFANGRSTKNEPLLGLYRRHLASLQRNYQQPTPSTSATNMVSGNGHSQVTISGGNYVQENVPEQTPARVQPPQPTSPSSQRSLELRYPCAHSVNPHMQSVVARLETFKPQNGIRWPRERLRAGIDDLVNAGFFYLGERDRVKCWYCNGGLQNWDYDDDPWTEHAKWFPSCEYVRRVKGSVFVEDLLARYPNLNRPTPTVVRIPGSPPRGLDIPPSPPRNPSPSPVLNSTEVVNQAMGTLAYVTQAREMGFAEETIKALLKRKYETNGQFYGTSEEFLEALIPNSTSQVVQSPEHRQTRLNSIASAAGEQETSTSMLSQLKELEETRLCKVCRKEVSNMVLTPCGHLATCGKCVNGLRKCPICGRTVQDSIKTFRA